MKQAKQSSPSYDKLSEEEQQSVLRAAERIKHNIDEFFKHYSRPLEYRKVMPSVYNSIPKSLPIFEFMDWAQANDFILIHMTSGGRKLVFPAKKTFGLSNDDVLRMIVEFEEREEELRTMRKERARMFSAGQS